MNAAPTLAQLTAAVFELASQLHVERICRMALEDALKNLLADGSIDVAAAEPGFRPRSLAAADAAIAALLRAIADAEDPSPEIYAEEQRGGPSVD